MGCPCVLIPVGTHGSCVRHWRGGRASLHAQCHVRGRTSRTSGIGGLCGSCVRHWCGLHDCTSLHAQCHVRGRTSRTSLHVRVNEVAFFCRQAVFFCRDARLVRPEMDVICTAVRPKMDVICTARASGNGCDLHGRASENDGLHGSCVRHGGLHDCTSRHAQYHVRGCQPS